MLLCIGDKLKLIPSELEAVAIVITPDDTLKVGLPCLLQPLG